MRIYVAGKWGERKLCKMVMKGLEGLGHEITCDWTDHDYPAENVEAMLQMYAVKDIQGVRDADLVIFIALNEQNYRGAFVEMGAALGLGKPVIIVGNAIDSCIFAKHPLVKGEKSLDDIPSAVKLFQELPEEGK